MSNIFDDVTLMDSIVQRVIHERVHEEAMPHIVIGQQTSNYSTPVTLDWGGNGAMSTGLYVPRPVMWDILQAGIEIGKQMADNPRKLEAMQSVLAVI